MHSEKSEAAYEHPDDSRHTSVEAYEASRRQSVVSMTKNVSGDIKNPLTGIPKAKLLQNVQIYADRYELTHAIDHLKKGTLVAQYPNKFEVIEELDENDIRALREEMTHRWRLFKTLYFLILVNSNGATIPGWDQTGLNGANLSFPQEFDIADTGSACEAAGTCAVNSWIVGAINAAPYMAIALL